MVIDDLANRVHDCDLLLDQNLVAQMHARYTDKVPAACGLLLGPEYALLRPIYGELHDRIPLRGGPIGRIFVFFGGADSSNLTGRTLAAFIRLNRPDIEVDVVITPGGPHEKAIRGQAAGNANIHLYAALPTLASLMVKADLAIGAGGATNWERLCLGLPTLVVSLADNQRPICEELHRRDLIHWLGHQDEVDEAAIAQALETYIGRDLDEGWSRRCRATIDGHGAVRVCAALAVTADDDLRIRYATQGDEELLLVWANDPATRRNAFSPERITSATHRVWFHSRLRNPDGCRLYIVETMDGVPLGFVRFERSGQDWEVHYALAPVFRGRGLAHSALKAALLKLSVDQRGTSVFGRVKDGNKPSCKVFESLDFEAHRISRQSVVVYRRTL